MSAGAFSDEGVVKAAGRIVCVFVDCDWGKKHSDLSDKYNVQGYPTVIYSDPDGKQIAEMEDPSAKAMIKQIDELAAKYPGGVAALESWEKAVGKANEDKKPVLYLFTTSKADSKELEKALGDESLKDLLERFIVVKSEIKKESADAKLFQVAGSTQPVLLILDPKSDKPAEKPLKKLTGKKTAKELKKELEAALKKFEEGK